MAFNFLAYGDLKSKTEAFIQGELDDKNVKSIDELPEPRRTQTNRIKSLIIKLDEAALGENTKSKLLTALLYEIYEEVDKSYDGMLYYSLIAIGLMDRKNSYFFRNLPAVWGQSETNILSNDEIKDFLAKKAVFESSNKTIQAELNKKRTYSQVAAMPSVAQAKATENHTKLQQNEVSITKQNAFITPSRVKPVANNLSTEAAPNAQPRYRR